MTTTTPPEPNEDWWNYKVINPDVERKNFGDGLEDVVTGFYRAQSFLNVMNFECEGQIKEHQLNTIVYIRSVLRYLFQSRLSLQAEIARLREENETLSEKLKDFEKWRKEMEDEGSLGW